MEDYLRSKGKFLKDLNKKIKGSRRDPSFGLKAIIVFLLIFISFFSKNNFHLVDNVFKVLEKPEIFAGLRENDLFINSSNSSSPESPGFLLMESSFVRASSPPTLFSPQVLGALAGGYEPEEKTRRAIVEHIIESGDTLSSLAVEYDISLDTILWANNLTRSSTLKIGQKLVILPVSGVLHYVQEGENIGYLAQLYKADAGQIVSFNKLEDEGRIYIGDLLVVPDGKMPPPVQRQPAPAATPLAPSYFIAPVSSPYIITRELHWNNAIDFSHQGYACGKPVFAAAGGTVQRVAYGRTGYGNYITISHPNGVVTLYAHLSNILVSSGQSVSQGTRVGLMGNTGYTIGPTGCHLHFEVRGARNPFAY